MPLSCFRVGTAGLTREQRYQLALEQIKARERGFQAVTRVVSFLALLLAVVAGYTIAMSKRDGPKTSQPTSGENDSSKKSDTVYNR